MKNLTNPQTELLKYLNSQLIETQKEINIIPAGIAYWDSVKESEDSNVIRLEVIDYEINKLITQFEVLSLRFKWLDAQLEAYVPSLK